MGPALRGLTHPRDRARAIPDNPRVGGLQLVALVLAAVIVGDRGPAGRPHAVAAGAYSPLLWGSLANLLWWRACRRAGVDVPLVRVALLGLGVSAGCVLTGTTAIWAVGLLTA